VQTDVLIKEECILKKKKIINYFHIRSYLCFITFVLKLLDLTLYWWPVTDVFMGGSILAFCACELILLFYDVFCLLILLVCSNKKNELGGAYGTYGGQEGCIQGFDGAT